MDEVIFILKEEIPDVRKRKVLYEKLIEAFRNMDWDTEDECLGKDIIFDEALGYYED